MNELFPKDTGLLDSPRRKWLNKHHVRTQKSPCVPDDEEPWNCWQGTFSIAGFEQRGATGATEDEAITNWAKLNGIKLWNEEES